MDSQRNILSKLLEGSVEVEKYEDLDEKTYTVGDTQYWRRMGKCYSWTQSGGRVEISEDEYMKAISGGNGSSPKNTEPKDDASGSTSSNSTTTSASSSGGSSVDVEMNGRKYTATVDGMSGEDLAKKYNDIAKHSPGRAIQWLKKNGTIEKKPEDSDSVSIDDMRKALKDDGDYSQDEIDMMSVGEITKAWSELPPTNPTMKTPEPNKAVSTAKINGEDVEVTIPDMSRISPKEGKVEVMINSGKHKGEYAWVDAMSVEDPSGELYKAMSKASTAQHAKSATAKKDEYPGQYMSKGASSEVEGKPTKTYDGSKKPLEYHADVLGSMEPGDSFTFNNWVGHPMTYIHIGEDPKGTPVFGELNKDGELVDSTGMSGRGRYAKYSMDEILGQIDSSQSYGKMGDVKEAPTGKDVTKLKNTALGAPPIPRRPITKGGADAKFAHAMKQHQPLKKTSPAVKKTKSIFDTGNDLLQKHAKDNETTATVSGKQVIFELGEEDMGNKPLIDALKKAGFNQYNSFRFTADL